MHRWLTALQRLSFPSLLRAALSLSKGRGD